MPEEKPVILPNRPQWARGAREIVDWLVRDGNALKVLEFGSGASSLYLAERVGHITTVEHHPEWAAAVSEQAPANLTLVQHDLPYNSVAEGFAEGEFDIIIIDGRGRVDCAFAAEPKLKPGGLLIFDDTHRPKYQPFLQSIRHWVSAAFSESIEETFLAQKPYLVNDDIPGYVAELRCKLNGHGKNFRSYPSYSQHIKTFGFEGGFDQLAVKANPGNAADTVLKTAGHLDFVVKSVQPTLMELRTGHVVWQNDRKYVLDCFHRVVSKFGIDRQILSLSDLEPKSLRHTRFRYQRGTMIDLSARGAALFSFWLLDVMPLVLQVREIYGADFVPDHVLINKAMPFAREGLELLGWGSANIIETVLTPHTGPDKDMKVFGAETLIVPGKIREQRFTPRWAIDFLREIIGPPKASGPERIYLSRVGAHGRHVENEDEMFAMLAQDFGFERCVAEDLGLRGAVDMFGNAKAFLSPHGAGLANMLFMPAGGQVFELFSAHYTSQYRLQAWSCEMGYQAFYAPKPGQKIRSGKEPVTKEINRQDMKVDVKALRDFLQKILL